MPRRAADRRRTCRGPATIHGRRQIGTTAPFAVRHRRRLRQACLGSVEPVGLDRDHRPSVSIRSSDRSASATVVGAVTHDRRCPASVSAAMSGGAVLLLVGDHEIRLPDRDDVVDPRVLRAADPRDVEVRRDACTSRRTDEQARRARRDRLGQRRHQRHHAATGRLGWTDASEVVADHGLLTDARPASLGPSSEPLLHASPFAASRLPPCSRSRRRTPASRPHWSEHRPPRHRRRRSHRPTGQPTRMHATSASSRATIRSAGGPQPPVSRDRSPSVDDRTGVAHRQELRRRPRGDIRTVSSISRERDA